MEHSQQMEKDLEEEQRQLHEIILLAQVDIRENLQLVQEVKVPMQMEMVEDQERITILLQGLQEQEEAVEMEQEDKMVLQEHREALALGEVLPDQQILQPLFLEAVEGELPRPRRSQNPWSLSQGRFPQRQNRKTLSRVRQQN